MGLFNEISGYFSNKVFWWDYSSPPARSKDLINVGWCSVYPPVENGVASVTSKMINNLLGRPELALYAIPLKGIVDKKLFPGLKFARLNDEFLDVVIFCCLGTGFSAVAEKTKAKKIAWQTVHNSPVDSTTPRPWMQPFDGDRIVFDQMKDSDLCITVNRWAAEEYKRLGLENVLYIPLGTETENKNVKKTAGKDHLKIFFISRLQYYKGIVPFLETMDHVLKSYPETEFYMHAPIDKNSDYLEEMLTLIRKYEQKYPSAFKYQDCWLAEEEITKIYETSDIFLFPSTNEGFGVPLIEAMSYGIPCLATDRLPMSEIVDDGVNGFCIPVDKKSADRYHGVEFPSPKDMAEKIIELIEHPERIREMGQQAVEKVRREYCIDKVTDRLIEQVKKNN